jgi:hypothetical protein
VRLFLFVVDADRGRDNNRGDSDETQRTAKRANIGRRAAHQWNICAEPAW